jgi:hypothetical protein
MTKKVVESKNEVVNTSNIPAGGVPSAGSSEIRGIYGIRTARRRIKEASLCEKEPVDPELLINRRPWLDRKLIKSPAPTVPKPPAMAEEAPVNNAGGGNIAGLGVGSPDKPANWGEPGVSKRNQQKHGTNVLKRDPPKTIPLGTFCGQKTFIVPDSMVNEVRMQKRKGKWWTNYLGENDDISNTIREYANANPHEPIILEGEHYGNIVFARYGKHKYNV